MLGMERDGGRNRPSSDRDREIRQSVARAGAGSCWISNVLQAVYMRDSIRSCRLITRKTQSHSHELRRRHLCDKSAQRFRRGSGLSTRCILSGSRGVLDETPDINTHGCFLWHLQNSMKHSYRDTIDAFSPPAIPPLAISTSSRLHADNSLLVVNLT